MTRLCGHLEIILMYLMAELAGEVERRVSAVRAGVDVSAAVAREQLDHVRVAVLGRPVERGEARDEVARLGQARVLAQQLRHGDVVALRGPHHPRLDVLQGDRGGNEIGETLACRLIKAEYFRT